MAALILLTAGAYRGIYLQKSLFFGSTDSFHRVMLDAVPIDLFSVVAITGLLMLQLFAGQAERRVVK